MKKGFTLIELLAVIVILAIVALIAMPKISGLVEKSKKGGAEQSALGYIDATEKQAVFGQLNNIDINTDEVYTVDELTELGVKVKGQKPSSGVITFDNSKIDLATLCIDNYKVEIEDGKVAKTTKVNNCKVEAKYPKIAYSNSVQPGYVYLSEISNNYEDLKNSEFGLFSKYLVNPVSGNIKNKSICIYNNKFSEEILCLTGDDFNGNVIELFSFESSSEEFSVFPFPIKVGSNSPAVKMILSCFLSFETSFFQAFFLQYNHQHPQNQYNYLLNY